MSEWIVFLKLRWGMKTPTNEQTNPFRSTIVHIDVSFFSASLAFVIISFYFPQQFFVLFYFVFHSFVVWNVTRARLLPKAHMHLMDEQRGHCANATVHFHAQYAEYFIHMHGARGTRHTPSPPPAPDRFRLLLLYYFCGTFVLLS